MDSKTLVKALGHLENFMRVLQDANIDFSQVDGVEINLAALSVFPAEVVAAELVDEIDYAISSETVNA